MRQRTLNVKLIENFIYNCDLKKEMKERPMLLKKIIETIKREDNLHIGDIAINQIEK